MLARLEWNANGSLGLHNCLLGRRCRDPLICLSCQYDTAELLTPLYIKAEAPQSPLLAAQVICVSPWHPLPRYQWRNVCFPAFSAARTQNGNCHNGVNHPAHRPNVTMSPKIKAGWLAASFMASFCFIFDFYSSYHHTHMCFLSAFVTGCNKQTNHYGLISMFCLKCDQENHLRLIMIFSV